MIAEPKYVANLMDLKAIDQWLVITQVRQSNTLRLLTGSVVLFIMTKSNFVLVFVSFIKQASLLVSLVARSTIK